VNDITTVHKQVYLLMPMDRAMLPHTKSTILHCTPTNRQVASTATDI